MSEIVTIIALTASQLLLQASLVTSDATEPATAPKVDQKCEAPFIVTARDHIHEVYADMETCEVTPEEAVHKTYCNKDHYTYNGEEIGYDNLGDCIEDRLPMLAGDMEDGKVPEELEKALAEGQRPSLEDLQSALAERSSEKPDSDSSLEDILSQPIDVKDAAPENDPSDEDFFRKYDPMYTGNTTPEPEAEESPTNEPFQTLSSCVSTGSCEFEGAEAESVTINDDFYTGADAGFVQAENDLIHEALHGEEFHSALDAARTRASEIQSIATDGNLSKDLRDEWMSSIRSESDILDARRDAYRTNSDPEFERLQNQAQDQYDSLYENYNRAFDAYEQGNSGVNYDWAKGYQEAVKEADVFLGNLDSRYLDGARIEDLQRSLETDFPIPRGTTVQNNQPAPRQPGFIDQVQVGFNTFTQTLGGAFSRFWPFSSS